MNIPETALPNVVTPPGRRVASLKTKDHQSVHKKGRISSTPCRPTDNYTISNFRDVSLSLIDPSPKDQLQYVNSADNTINSDPFTPNIAEQFTPSDENEASRTLEESTMEKLYYKSQNENDRISTSNDITTTPLAAETAIGTGKKILFHNGRIASMSENQPVVEVQKKPNTSLEMSVGPIDCGEYLGRLKVFTKQKR